MEVLFEEDPEYVVERYKTWTKSKKLNKDDLVTSSDLFLVHRDGHKELFLERGEFNWRNQYNQKDGIAHLSHRANSLEAEVNLAVTSALPRHDGARKLVDATRPKRLMCCTGGGDPNRSSDPLIAAGAYAAVTDPSPKRFTLTNPIGLYIRTFEFSGLQTPEGPGPRDWWTVERGKDATEPGDPFDARILRLKVEVPKDSGLGLRLGDLKVNGEALVHPGQLAKLVRMHLLVDIWDTLKSPPSIACRGGCCEKDEVLDPYKGRPKCQHGWRDAFPGLTADGPTPKPPLRGMTRSRLAQ